MGTISQAITPAPLQEVQLKAKAAPGSLTMVSLYITGLDGSVTEDRLHDLFVEFGQILSVKVCRDHSTGASRGCGYVNYSSLRDATEALKSMNFKFISGKPIRVMFSYRNSSIQSGGSTVFFKNVFASLDIKDIDKVFSGFGTIVASELAKDCRGRSKGYGFVKFDQEEAAKRAIHSLNGSDIMRTEVYANPFICKEKRDQERKKFQNFPTLFVKKFHEEILDEEVRSVFEEYGSVVHVNIIREPEVSSFTVRRPFNKGFGFVVFENFDEALSAIKGLNGQHASKIKRLEPMCIDNAVWYVGWAKSLFKREGANLYIKNLDNNISNRFLMRLFSEFGVITSKVMLDSQGRSRGYAFVAFATPEDARRAMNVMNGKTVGRKPLNISVARKRKTDPQAHIAQPQELVPYLYNRESCEELEKAILSFDDGRRGFDDYIGESLEKFLGKIYYCSICGCIWDKIESTREHLMDYHPFLSKTLLC